MREREKGVDTMNDSEQVTGGPNISKDGAVAIVTGAASGLGLMISERLSREGIRVVMADVDIDSCRREAERLIAKGDRVVEAMYLDLADLESVRAFSELFLRDNKRLDLLLNNAGIMCPPLKRTSQGYESQFGVNHLGHFALTARLLPILASTPGSRVVVQTSIVHDTATIDFDDIDSGSSYSSWKAYKQSKLAMLLFALELQRRLSTLGIDDPISVACHPGLVDTALYRNSRFMRLFLMPFMHGREAGIAPALMAALDPDVKGGELYGPDGWRGFKGRAVRTPPLGQGNDVPLASRLWTVSKDMVAIDMDEVLCEIAHRNLDPSL